MKMKDAIAIMEGFNERKGFLVQFEHVGGRILRSDYFPDIRAGEPAIETEEEAWAMARQFASKTRHKCVNLYVVHARDFTPVPNYNNRKILNR